MSNVNWYKRKSNLPKVRLASYGMHISMRAWETLGKPEFVKVGTTESATGKMQVVITASHEEDRHAFKLSQNQGLLRLHSRKLALYLKEQFGIPVLRNTTGTVVLDVVKSSEDALVLEYDETGD